MNHDSKVYPDLAIPIHAGCDSFSWSNVSYKVKAPKEKPGEMKTLLSGMYGQVNKGQVVAIMGGSGAGKTTALNTLAGRIGPGELGGDILLDGKPRDPGTWRLVCGYVEQDDLMSRNLTVQETLMFAALLRLPSSMSKADKMARVETIILELGLNGCRNTPIGDGLLRGVSGGERKRVSIGIELIADPHILFLDEPTSGLDAFNAFNVISQIKDYAVKSGKIVLLTIHQPRNDILALFDKIILVATGRTAWFGSTRDGLSFFEKNGFKIPPNTNPSDFFLDLITLDQRSTEQRDSSLARINLLVDSYEEMRAKESQVVEKVEYHEAQKLQWPSTWSSEFGTLLRRSFLDLSRDTASLMTALGQAVFMAVFIGIIYLNIPDDAAGSQNRLGVLFFLCINLMMSVVMPTVSIFPLKRAMIKRERSGGAYRSSSAYLAAVISSLPVSFLASLITIIPIYWMVGFQNDVTKFLTYICIMLVHTLIANAMGLMIGSFVPNVNVGLSIAPVILVVFILFGGQLLNLNTVTVVFRWIQWISVIAYTYKALLQNELDDNLIFSDCPANSPNCFHTGTQVVEHLGLDSPTLWHCVSINVGLAAGLLILGFIFFNRTSSPLLKLK